MIAFIPLLSRGIPNEDTFESSRVKFATIVGVKMDKNSTPKDLSGQEGKSSEMGIKLGKHSPRTLEAESMKGCVVDEMSSKNSFPIEIGWNSVLKHQCKSSGQ